MAQEPTAHDALWVAGQLSSLRDPVVLAAFWGWGDATGSALGALRYLRDAWQANEVATVDPDRFYDLSIARPRRVVAADGSSTRWPGTRFYVADPHRAGRDFVILTGREPALAWRTYCELVADFMREVGASDLLMLGSRPAAVPHTRPSPITLSSAAPRFEELLALGSEAIRYEGPTGIGTALLVHLQSSGFRVGRLSVLVPYYVRAGPQPQAMLALVQKLLQAFGIPTQIAPLQDQVAVFAEQVSRAIDQLDDGGQVRDHVRDLEEQYDALDPSTFSAAGPREPGFPNSDEIVGQIEEFLRRQAKDAPGDEPGSSTT